MSAINRYKAMAPTSENWRQMLNTLDQVLDAHSAQIGQNQTQFQDNPQVPSQSQLGPPPLAQFSVGANGGIFLVSITNPQNVQPQTAMQLQNQAGTNRNQRLGTLYHQVQSCPNSGFSGGSVQTYGPSQQTTVTVNAGSNVSWWFRFRSSYDGQVWNQWQTSPGAVNSGS